MKMVFKRLMERWRNSLGIAFQSLAPKLEKETLVLIRSWSLDIIISRSRKPGLMLVLWISVSKEITNVRQSIQAGNVKKMIEGTFSACNMWKGRIFEEINNYTAYALGSEKYIKWRTRFCSTRMFCKWVLVGWPQAAKPYVR